MSYSDAGESGIFTVIAVPITIIKFCGRKIKKLMVLIIIEAVNVEHKPCVNRLWGAIGSVGGAEVSTNATVINLEWKTHYDYIPQSHFYDGTRV